jgi:hypothetical protein
MAGDMKCSDRRLAVVPSHQRSFIHSLPNGCGMNTTDVVSYSVVSDIQALTTASAIAIGSSRSLRTIIAVP